MRSFSIFVAILLANWPTRLFGDPAMPPWHGALAPALARLADSPYDQQAQAEALAMSAGADAALVIPDPTLSLGVAAAPLGGTLTGDDMTMAPTVGFSQMLPFPGKLRASRQGARAEAAVVLAEAMVRRQTLAYELAEAAFMQARVSAELQAVATAANDLERLASAASARYQAGQGGRFDVERLAVEAGRIRAATMRLRAELAEHGQHWAQIFGRGDPPGLPPDDEAIWPDAIAVVNEAAAHNPALKVQAYALAAAEAMVSQRRTQFFPDLAINVEYGVRRNGRADMLSGMLGVSLPLWASRSQAPELKAVRQRAVAAGYALKAMSGEVSAASDRLIAAHRQAVLQNGLFKDELRPKAQAARQAVLAAYSAGGLDAGTAVEVVQLALMTEREYLQAAAERRRLEAQILALAGYLTIDQTTKD